MKVNKKVISICIIICFMINFIPNYTYGSTNQIKVFNYEFDNIRRNKVGVTTGSAISIDLSIKSPSITDVTQNKDLVIIEWENVGSIEVYELEVNGGATRCNMKSIA